MSDRGSGKIRDSLEKLRPAWIAIQAVLTVSGLAALAGQAMNAWSGLDAGTRGGLTVAATVSLVIGGSSILYNVLRSIDARRTPAQSDRRTERIARLVDELKLYAAQFAERVSRQDNFGLYNLIMNNAGGDLPGLYSRVHVNGYSPIRENIAGFMYAPGRERDLVSLVRPFEAHAESHGEFIDLFVKGYSSAGRPDPGLFLRIGVCVADYNHFIAHMRLWQDELALLVGADAYQPAHLRPRTPPTVPHPPAQA